MRQKEGHMYGLLLPSRPLQCPNCLSRATNLRGLFADDSYCLHPWHGPASELGFLVETVRGFGVHFPRPAPTGHECCGTYKTFAAAHCPYCKPKGKPDSTDDYTTESVAA